VSVWIVGRTTRLAKRKRLTLLRKPVNVRLLHLVIGHHRGVQPLIANRLRDSASHDVGAIFTVPQNAGRPPLRLPGTNLVATTEQATRRQIVDDPELAVVRGGLSSSNRFQVLHVSGTRAAITPRPAVACLRTRRSVAAATVGGGGGPLVMRNPPHPTDLEYRVALERSVRRFSSATDALCFEPSLHPLHIDGVQSAWQLRPRAVDQ